jgi:hypothetical protein
MKGDKMESVEDDSIEIKRRLEELAIEFQKTDGKGEWQDKDVLVNKIEEQYKNGKDPIVFSIPFNPAFIPSWKKRDKDGLDDAQRLALDNLAKFAKKVNKITGKKVAINLVYDTSITNGVEPNLVKANDYLKGVIAIYLYVQALNNSKIQIRGYDIGVDSNKQQPVIFLETENLDLEHSDRLEKLNKLFESFNDEEKIFEKMEKEEKLPLNVDIKKVEDNKEWLSTIGVNDESGKIANNIARSERLFETIDERTRGSIIRLSPHKRDVGETEKFGFSFFPKTKILHEPWIRNLDRPYTELAWKERPKILIRDKLNGESKPLDRRGVAKFEFQTHPSKITQRANQIREILREKILEYEKKCETTEITKRGRRFIIFKNILLNTKKQLDNDKSALSFLSELQKAREIYKNGETYTGR